MAKILAWRHEKQSSPTQALSYEAWLSRPSKGLLGLAITHTTFNATDIEYVMELLAVYPPTEGMTPMCLWL
jgi:hypothetical protein